MTPFRNRLSPLTKRMAEDMLVRNLSPRTIDSYTYHVDKFVAYFGKPAEELGPEEIRQYQLYLIQEKNVGWSSFNQLVCSLRFLYRFTIPRDWHVKMIPFGKRPKKLPAVLGQEQAMRLIECAKNLKHRTVLLTLYAAGLRLSEALHLQAADIDSQRMQLRVTHGKGSKQRLVPLSPRLLAALREYWKQYRPPSYLFTGKTDELCLLNGMQTNNPGHHQAVVALHTGNENFVRPSVGAWATYGLGSEAESLPGFVTINPIGDKGGAANYGSAFLPATFQGTRLSSSSRGVSNIRNHNLSNSDQRKQLDFVQQANRRLLARDAQNPEIAGLIESAELAFRMQTSVPETLDLSRESQTTQRLYGLDDQRTARFGTQCLMARRLAEKGVRFIQLTSNGWDHHSRMREAFSLKATSIDRPIAGLIADLKQRDLLRDTLIIWGGEFGRQPIPDNNGGRGHNNDGRGHNNKGYTMWMAGGGVKGGFQYGATDELGGRAENGQVHRHDLHATILHLLGLDHEQLTYHYSGRDFRLTDTAGTVAHDILA